MTTYYTLLQTLNTYFKQDINVNTISTQDDHNIIDNYKKNIYPLVHLTIQSSPFISEQTTAVTRYEVEVNVLDIRDINKEEVNDKFWLNDNRHDNLNTTMAILKTASNKMIKDTLGIDVTLESATSAVPVIYAFKNVLDGWTQTWTIDVPDTLTTVCSSLFVVSWSPSSERDPYNFTSLDITFNKAITLESGTMDLYYEGATLGDSLTESDMSVSGSVLTIDVSSKPLSPAPVGTYHFTLSQGLVSFKGLLSNAILDDSYTIEVN